MNTKFRRLFTVFTAALLLLAAAFGPVGAKEADAAAFVDYKIEINKRTNKLYLYKNGSVVKVYPVATGRTSSLTPEGTFPIVVKIVKPGWKGIPGGHPNNPLGERWNGLSVRGDNGRTYGIHGTNDPSSIGKHASSGCVRMHNNHVIELYNTIHEGTAVWIHSGTSNNKWRGDSRVGLKPASGQVKITADNVNARTGPSTGSFVITQLRKGTVLPLIGTSGDWYQVLLSNGRKAFVHKPLASTNTGSAPNTGSPSFSSASGQVVISVNRANVRQQPSLSSKVLYVANKGTKFTLTGDSKEWFRVRLSNGSTAYLHHSVAQKAGSGNSSFTPASGKVAISVNRANVRQQPSLSSKVLYVATKGTTFTLTGDSKEWFRVRLSNGSTAYLHHSVARKK
ncbi:SH3 domain-containing protein [Staphylospora marina]|uniref:SH3 domain-containing protein n=1 Tax=Staphylospora marina TaxID=2490858 RepID=UPI000F5B9D58|nr:SH3 domain-containing protein [Staphylospora marina]